MPGAVQIATLQKLLARLQSPHFKLKLFVWLVFLALLIVFAVSKLLSSRMGAVFSDMFDDAALPIESRGWLRFPASGADWAVLSPWFAYCLLGTLRPNIQIESCLLYAGTAAFTGVVTIIGVIIAVYLPFIIIADQIGR